MKIAVIGSGISGLSAAYYLSKKHKVDLFEKEDQFGGHANTIKVIYDDKKEISVDIGFMVFNQKTYPNLINFFLENKIEIEKSDMSLSVYESDSENYTWFMLHQVVPFEDGLEVPEILASFKNKFRETFKFL